ncbi:UNVERIFIED_ORG: phosphatidylserine decarboxylase [Atlantibacter sp. SORGH_AS 304]|nr:phosphatidylserine decarboxylase [Atlantibacter sp. SORGH_AS_0304]
MLNSFKLSLQYILPKLWLTRLAGWGASKRAGWLTKLVIDLFVKYYKVDMKEAQKPDTASYRSFNEFFVRPRCATRCARLIPIRTCWSCRRMA